MVQTLMWAFILKFYWGFTIHMAIETELFGGVVVQTPDMTLDLYFIHIHHH